MPRTHAPVPLHRLDVPEPHLLPFAIGTFDTIGPLSRAAFPHRHTFHEIVYLTGGHGSHVVDLCARPIRPPALCVIAPGQVHFWQDAHALRGWVVLFDDAFLLAHPRDRDLLHRLAGHPQPHLDPAADAGIRPLLTGMVSEYRTRGPGMASVLQSYLHILAVRALRAARAPGDGGHDPAHGPAAPDTPAADLARRFARLLARIGEHPSPSPAPLTVRTCAAELGVTAGYLTEAVKAATGRTPGSLIRRARVLEAKRLLAGTGLTVGRVARETGFSDPAYFCRFFRRETGSSPGEFRRNAGRMHHADRAESIDPGVCAP